MSDRQATPFMMCGYQHLKAPQTDDRLLKQAHGAVPVSKARSGSAGKELANLDVGVLKLSLGGIDRTTATSKGFAHVGSAGMIDDLKGEKLGIGWDHVYENYGAGKPPAQAQLAGKKRSKRDISLTRSVKNLFKRGTGRSTKKSGSEESEDTANDYVDQSMMSADLGERKCCNGHNKPDLPAGDGRRLAPRALSQSGPHNHMASNECLSYEDDPFNTSTLKVFRGARDDGNLYDSFTNIYETYESPMEPAAAPDGTGNRPSEPQSRSDVDEDAVYDAPPGRTRSSYEPLPLPRQHPGTLPPQKTLTPIPAARSSGPRPNYGVFMPPTCDDLPGSSEDRGHHADPDDEEYDDRYEKIQDVDNDLCTDGACSDAQSTNSDDENHYYNYPAVLHAAEKESTTLPIYARSAKEKSFDNVEKVSISPETVPVSVLPVTRSRPTPAPRTSIERPSPELPEVQRYLDEYRNLLRASGEYGATEKAACHLDFAVRMLDEKGGRLQLVAHGITLDVPPGALGDSPREVYVYVQRTSQPSLARDSAFVTPVVHCGRSGLKFNIPVVLTFPVHVKDPSQWKLSGVRQNSSSTLWKELSGSSDSLVKVENGFCTIITDHFTGFGVVASPEEPNGASGNAGEAEGLLPLRVGVYRSEMLGHQYLQLRVRIWDDSEHTREHIDREEIHGKLLDTTRKLFLRMPNEGALYRDPGLDLVVVISKLNPLWETEDLHQVVDLAKLQPDRSGRVDASCTFNLQLRRYGVASLPCDEGRPGMHLLNCDLDIGQRSHQQLSVTIRALDLIAGQTGARDSYQQFLLSNVGSRRSSSNNVQFPIPCSDDQETTIYEVPSRQKRKSGPSTDTASASGGRLPVENDEDPDCARTLLSTDIPPNQVAADEEPTLQLHRRQDPMEQDYSDDQMTTIRKVPTRQKRKIGPSTDKASASGGMLPVENDKDPDRARTLLSTDIPPNQVAADEAPTLQLHRRQDPMEQDYSDDQMTTIRKVPTRQKRKTGRSTDAASASGGKQPEENEEPDRARTPLSTAASPNQAAADEEPSRQLRRRQDPTEQDCPCCGRLQSPCVCEGDVDALEQNNHPYSVVTIAEEKIEFEQDASQHYKNAKVLRGLQPSAKPLKKGYVVKQKGEKQH